MSQSDAGKGDGHRPVLVSREEHEFRKSVAWGEIKVSERAYKRLERRQVSHDNLL